MALITDSFPKNDDGNKVEVYAADRYRDVNNVSLGVDGVYTDFAKEFDINIVSSDTVEIFSGRALMGGLTFNADIIGSELDSESFVIISDIVSREYYIALRSDITTAGVNTNDIVIISTLTGAGYVPPKNKNGIYELLLHKILVPAGAVNIQPADITDLRVFNSLHFLSGLGDIDNFIQVGTNNLAVGDFVELASTNTSSPLRVTGNGFPLMSLANTVEGNSLILTNDGAGLGVQISAGIHTGAVTKLIQFRRDNNTLAFDYPVSTATSFRQNIMLLTALNIANVGNINNPFIEPNAANSFGLGRNGVAWRFMFSFAYNGSCDRFEKENIITISVPRETTFWADKIHLDKLNKIEVFKYNLKDNSTDDTVMGFMADQLKTVDTNGDMFLKTDIIDDVEHGAVNLIGMLAFQTQAMKEMSEMIETLEQRITELENK